MRIAFSNIAWDVSEDKAAAGLLRRLEIDAIDIAPGKYFPDPAQAKDNDIKHIRRTWADQGIEITGMQALLFGVSGLNLFGSAQIRQTMLDRLAAVARIAARLNAPRLVFGSPKNRDRSGLTDAQAMEHALDFFSRLGDIAAREGVIFCLEPNPERYHCNFMTHTAEAADMVRQIAHKNIRLQLDTGAIAINQETPEQVVKQFSDLIGHIHASEPDLVTLGDGGADHKHIGELLQSTSPEHIVTIEMTASRTEEHLKAVQRAGLLAKSCYCESKPSLKNTG